MSRLVFRIAFALDLSVLRSPACSALSGFRARAYLNVHEERVLNKLIINALEREEVEGDEKYSRLCPVFV